MTYLRIRELCEERGMNISHLKEKAGIAYGTAHNLWRDRTELLNRRTLDRVAIALGVRVSDLFGGDPEVEESDSQPILLAA